MPSFLVFSLWAPLASMGDVAVGERRYGVDRPGKSAVIGLIAAALGIERAEEASHQALMAGYGFAVQVDAPGTLLSDFHTAQVPPARKGKRWATRRDELAEPDLETILSWREYRCDARFSVALWARPAAPHPLEDLARSLARPHFTLYVGRKACPLGLPPGPKILEADGLAAVFSTFAAALPEIAKPLFAGCGTIHADAEAAEQGWLDADFRGNRRDEVVSRKRWQFGLRAEAIAVARTAARTAARTTARTTEDVR